MYTVIFDILRDCMFVCNFFLVPLIIEWLCVGKLSTRFPRVTAFCGGRKLLREKILPRRQERLRCRLVEGIARIYFGSTRRVRLHFSCAGSRVVNFFPGFLLVTTGFCGSHAYSPNLFVGPVFCWAGLCLASIITHGFRFFVRAFLSMATRTCLRAVKFVRRSCTVR